MPIQITLYRAQFTPVDFQLPDHCPGCGADFREEGALRESDWTDGTIHCHASEDDSGCLIDDGASWDYGDTFMPVFLACGSCDWVLDPEGPPECKTCPYQQLPNGECQEARSAGPLAECTKAQEV